MWGAVALIEWRTRNRESPGSNHLCYHFEVWAFSFSPRCPSSPSYVNEYLTIECGGNMSQKSSRVIAAWLECSAEKSRWCRNE